MKLFEKTPTSTILRTVTKSAIVAIMAIFTISAIMANHHMTTNMIVMGVYSKSSKNADQLQKWFVKRCNVKKVM